MIPLIKSSFYNEKATKKALKSFISDAQILSFSTQCQLFEKNFSKFQKRKHSVFVNSGSSANLAIVQALLNLGRLKKGDLVGFSALTWSTNVMPLIELGLEAVPIDVELDTLNVSSKKLLEALEKYKFKMLFITNLLGFCDDIDEIKAVCDKKKIILVEDNCESFGTVYKKKLLGNFGLASTFSFYVGHHMSTIEGGMVCTDDEELACMLQLVRAHGWDRNMSAERQERIRQQHKVNSTFYSRYTFYELGYNLRPTEINGFIGNTQLPYANEIFQKRQKNFETFAKAIYSRTDKYYPLRYDHISFVSNFAVPVVCRSVEIRDELVQKCNGKLEIRPIVGGDMTLQPFYRKHMKQHLGFFKKSNSQLAHQQGLYFGNNPELTAKEIKFIISLMTE